MTEEKSPQGQRRWLVWAVWLALMAAACALMAAWRGTVLSDEMAQARDALGRQVAQRADQHDAHLTALSAIATAEAGGHDLFLDVAATIEQFYPRIVAVGLVPLDPAAPAATTRPLSPALSALVRQAAQQSGGRLAVLPHPEEADHYLLVKRSPNNEAARYGVMLDIQAGRLLDDAGPFWRQHDVTLGLALPDGTLLAGQEPETNAARAVAPIGSASQPLLLQTGRRIGLAERLPPWPTALLLLALSLLYGTAWLMLRQRARTRAAMEQARYSALESRLAHASRVNALGEMASGMAHELTQPLTAILAQTQAGRRLLARGEADRLAGILDDNIAQARRASAILERIRNWSSARPTAPQRFDLRETLRNVQTLLSGEAARHGVRLSVLPAVQPVWVRLDPVEIEQVVFNLVRNAIEAGSAAAGGGEVRLMLRREDGTAILDVRDNGPGVAAEMHEQLFMPFATTRPGGTGLGLSLSQRLVERAGGTIMLAAKDGPGACFRVTLPCLAETEEQNA
ncbi:sensor histidine kinase [Kerstersia sp.]|uniref:sensor histidine kinase n=1 Tax=Kerstersia sp. TaxID=1930783 RepID=UPI003F901C54